MPSSVGSYVQAAEVGPPPKREEVQSVRDKTKEEEAAKTIRSDAGDGRGNRLDINA